MKSLWVKDLLVLKKQSVAVLITLILAIFSLVFFKVSGVMIGMAIFAVTAAFVMLNALTFDQQNHGLLFLMTLPFSKQQYVWEKYLLLVGTIGSSTIIMTLISLGFNHLQAWNLPISAIFTRTYLVGLVVLLLLTFITQFQLKNGPEKTQLAMSMIGAVVAVIIGGVITLIKYTQWGKNVFEQLFRYYLAHGSLIFMVLFTLISVCWVVFAGKKSVKDLEKLEF